MLTVHAASFAVCVPVGHVLIVVVSWMHGCRQPCSKQLGIIHAVAPLLCTAHIYVSNEPYLATFAYNVTCNSVWTRC